MNAEAAAILDELKNHMTRINSPWMSINDVAQYLGCSRGTVCNLRDKGLIREYTIPNSGCPRFKREDIDKAVEQTAKP